MVKWQTRKIQNLVLARACGFDSHRGYLRRISMTKSRVKDFGYCAFCRRPKAAGIRGHHVVPKCKGGNVIEPTCSSCESFIHSTWSHNELRDMYNTVEAIVSDERFKKYLKWLCKQHSTATFKTRRRNDRTKGRYK